MITIPIRQNFSKMRWLLSWMPHLREVFLVAGAYFAYMYIRKLVYSDSAEIGLANAERIIALEKSLGVFWEPAWQNWIIENARFLAIVFNWAYIITFLPVILTTAVLVYVYRRRSYFYYRNVVLVSFIVALLGFLVFPLAPPRMLEEFFVDTIKDLGPAFYANREFANYYNAYAAMPSLHFGWTLIYGVMFFRSGSRWLKLLAFGYPTLTFFAIIVTGNHYILDAVGGALVALLSFLAVNLMARLARRHSHANEPETTKSNQEPGRGARCGTGDR